MAKAKKIKKPDKNSEDLFIKNQICFSIYSASRYVSQVYQSHLNPYDLTYLQFLVMLCLWENEGITVSDICKQLDLDTGTLSPLLKKLEFKEYILRERQTVDERVVLIVLTKKGRGLKTKIFPLRESLICESGLQMKELVELKAQLEKLSANLNTVIKAKNSLK